MSQVQATIAGRSFDLGAEQIERLLEGILPEPLGDHYVVVAGKRYPPKQVLSVVTGLDRADFNTHHARRILERLGFTVGRRSRDVLPPVPGRAGPHEGREAELLRPFIGMWVAQKGLEVLVAADTPEAVLSWLEEHDQHADAMFRVPANEREMTGIGPG